MSMDGFPRTRGDGPGLKGRTRRSGKFPPHSRGWTFSGRVRDAFGAVSPALAGMDPALPGFRRKGKRFPRTRGDGPLAFSTASIHRWFPPHSRGWTVGKRLQEARAVVSPALAGMDPSRFRRMHSLTSFPRTRGDGPKILSVVPGDVEFPPHSRGWTEREGRRRSLRDVSPALAGMDRQ